MLDALIYVIKVLSKALAIVKMMGTLSNLIGQIRKQAQTGE